MCALTQDVYYFRPFQIAELRGFLGSLRHLRKANQWWRVPRWSSSHWSITPLLSTATNAGVPSLPFKTLCGFEMTTAGAIEA